MSSGDGGRPSQKAARPRPHLIFPHRETPSSYRAPTRPGAKRSVSGAPGRKEKTVRHEHPGVRALDGTYAIGALQIQTKDENLAYWSSDGSGTAKMYYAMGGYDEVDLAFSYMPPNPIDTMAKRIDHLQSLPYRGGHGGWTRGRHAQNTRRVPRHAAMQKGRKQGIRGTGYKVSRYSVSGAR